MSLSEVTHKPCHSDCYYYIVPGAKSYLYSSNHPFTFLFIRLFCSDWCQSLRWTS